MSTSLTHTTFQSDAKEVIRIECQAIESLLDRINHHFESACEMVLATAGRVVMIGMGKSGHIANKIAATLASTGTPSFFVHPSEASHGDLGMITPQDTVILVSYSGETEELCKLLPILKHIGVPIISITGNSHSTIAKSSAVHLDVAIKQEACSLNLAPTSSTTATLVMGDAMAIALQRQRGFTALDFARHHPGGALGNQLLLEVRHIMHTEEDIPKVSPCATIKEALIEVSKKRLGMTTIVDKNQRLLGVFTDGDLRRCLDDETDLHNAAIKEVISDSPKTIAPSTLASTALEIMNNDGITTLVVTCKDNSILGIVHMHDILKRGISSC